MRFAMWHFQPSETCTLHKYTHVRFAAGCLRSLLCPDASSALCPVLHSASHLAVSKYTQVLLCIYVRCCLL